MEDQGGVSGMVSLPIFSVFSVFFFLPVFFREGANREKLTVKKIINNEMFFSPFMSLIDREKLCVNREKSAPKIHHFFTVGFSPFTSS